MKVVLTINGYLNQFFKQSCNELELTGGATLADLFAAVDMLFGASLPESVWSREKKKFRGPVTVSVGQIKISDPEYPLKEGQQISISRFLIGG